LDQICKNGREFYQNAGEFARIDGKLSGFAYRLCKLGGDIAI
jgi:hypothetical protein